MSTKYALVHDSWNYKLAYIFRSVDNHAEEWQIEHCLSTAFRVNSRSRWETHELYLTPEKGDKILTAEEYKQFYTNNIEMFL